MILNVTTDQEAFDAVCTQLGNQERRAWIGGSCKYRAPWNPPGSDRCAIGGLIPDDQYNSLIEGDNVRGLVSYRSLYTGIDIDLLSKLQMVHDTQGNWNLDSFTGRENGLSYVGWRSLMEIGVEFGLVLPK